MNKKDPDFEKVSELLLLGHTRIEIFKILVEDCKHLDPKEIGKLISNFPEQLEYQQNIKWIRRYLNLFIIFMTCVLLISLKKSFVAQNFFSVGLDIFSLILAPPLMWQFFKYRIFTAMLLVICIMFYWLIIHVSLFFYFDKQTPVLSFTIILLTCIYLALGIHRTKKTYKKIFPKKFVWDEVKKEPVFL